MAKDKKKKDKQPGRGEAVRSAVDQAFQATAEQAETARVGAQSIVDEFAQAAGRVREALEDLRPPTGDEVAELRTTVATLEARVAKLEADAKKPARRAPAKRATTSRAKKPAAAKSATPKPADEAGTGRS